MIHIYSRRALLKPALKCPRPILSGFGFKSERTLRNIYYSVNNRYKLSYHYLILLNYKARKLFKNKIGFRSERNQHFSKSALKVRGDCMFKRKHVCGETYGDCRSGFCIVNQIIFIVWFFTSKRKN